MLDHLFPRSPYILLLLPLAYVVYSIIKDHLQTRRVKQLGHDAPERPHHLPWGIDVMWDGVQHLRNHRNLDLWLKIFHVWGNKNNPYTVGTKIAGLRIIFTSDPENLKVIENFRRSFLFLSETQMLRVICYSFSI